VQSFEKQAKAYWRLEHENEAKLFALASEGGHVLVMKLCEDGNLEERLHGDKHA